MKYKITNTGLETYLINVLGYPYEDALYIVADVKKGFSVSDYLTEKQIEECDAYSK